MSSGELVKILFALVLASVCSLGFAEEPTAVNPPRDCRALPAGSLRDSGVNFELAAGPSEIKLMQYNVENLFDAVHDPGKEDYEFLPLTDPEKRECARVANPNFRRSCERTDWTDAKFQMKLNQIKRAVATQGTLPDVLALEEVENPGVVQRLASVLGYSNFVVGDSRDLRGIRVALMWRPQRLTYLSQRSIVVGPNNPDLQARPTRDILAVYFAPVEVRSARPLPGDKRSILDEPVAPTPQGNSIVAVYVNHWPSQGNPSPKRILAAEALKGAINEDVVRYGADLHVLALGDFNTIPSDSPHPFSSVLQNRTWRNALLDAQTLYETTGHARDSQQMLRRMAPGTYFFKRDFNWNRLDRIFVSSNLTDGQGLELVSDSFRVVSPDLISTPARSAAGCPEFLVPKSYDHNADNPEQAGFSDHYPVVVKVRLR